VINEETLQKAQTLKTKLGDKKTKQ